MPKGALDSGEHVGEKGARKDAAPVKGNQGNGSASLSLELNLAKVVT